jgi:RNA polymerase sigma factor (sigma-70 family)
MSIERVQEEWVSEEVIHERPHLEVIVNADLDPAKFDDPESIELQDGEEAEHDTPHTIELDLSVDKEAYARRSPIRKFFQYADQFPLLTPEEEKALGYRVQGGFKASEQLEANRDKLTGAEIEACQEIVEDGNQARLQFIDHNLRLAAKKAIQYYKASPSGEKYGQLDLINESILGLNRAVEKFDPEKGFRFTTYASWWIQHALDRGLVNKGTTLRVPDDVYDTLRKYERLNDQKLSEEQKMEELGISEAKYLDLMEARHIIRSGPTSINLVVGEKQESELVDLIEDPTGEEELNDRVYGSGGDLVKFLDYLRPMFTDADMRLLEQIATGQELSKGDVRHRRKIEFAMEHPAIWAQVIKYIEKSDDIEPRGDWREGANCIGNAELYAKADKTDKEKAKEICGSCVVRAECELYLVSNMPEKAVWIDGRTIASEKTRIRNEQKALQPQKPSKPRNKKPVTSK